ncbi:cell division protein FtsQ/DivIB [Sphaerisporangium fuscum]|uniref:cell division protein FtsQ/DivIB n=1 Tax=Sphaerisporangium fuscum TaxID=2835868 RepID=UPI001BDD3AB1|nr:FtsQ-type POTRA domain-containing protein [Sphaerisporangium fuscum]
MSPPAWRTALAVLLSCGVVGAAAWLVFFSPVLGVRDIAVSGNSLLPAERIRQAAAVPDHEPLATVDLDQVRRRISALPEIESARVERNWPGTLVVHVVERRPVALVQWGGRTSVVDRHGVAMEPTGVVPLPTLQVPRFASGDPATGAALAVAAGLPDDLARKVRAVRATTARDVTLALSDGRTIMWGGAERTGEKARVALTLLRRPGDSYDVSSPDVVSVK